MGRASGGGLGRPARARRARKRMHARRARTSATLPRAAHLAPCRITPARLAVSAAAPRCVRTRRRRRASLAAPLTRSRVATRTRRAMAGYGGYGAAVPQYAAPAAYGAPGGYAAPAAAAPGGAGPDGDAIVPLPAGTESMSTINWSADSRYVSASTWDGKVRARCRGGAGTGTAHGGGGGRGHGTVPQWCAPGGSYACAPTIHHQPAPPSRPRPAQVLVYEVQRGAAGGAVVGLAHALSAPPQAAPLLDHCWGPDGATIYTAGCDNTIKAWSLSNPTAPAVDVGAVSGCARLRAGGMARGVCACVCAVRAAARSQHGRGPPYVC
jgi:hypothetical protein